MNSEIIGESSDSLSHLPLLPQARQQLVREINTALESLLQEKNYPVGFEGITVPTVSIADIYESEGDEESAAIVISDGARAKIIKNIRTALETVYTQTKIQEKIEALEYRLLELDDEIEQIGTTIASLSKFDHQGNRPSKERTDEDIKNMKTRRDTGIPAEKREIQTQIEFLDRLQPFSGEVIETLCTQIETILNQNMGFRKEKKTVTKAAGSAPIVEEPSEPAMPTIPPTKGVNGLNIRTVAAIITILGVVAVAGKFGYDSIQTRAQEEKARLRNIATSLERHPSVVGWFGEEAKQLSVEEIESYAEKISLIQKYPELAKKYPGTAIKTVSMLELLFCKPEEFKNYPYYVKKLNGDWERMWSEHTSEILQEYNRGGTNGKDKILELLAKYYPDIGRVPKEIITFYVGIENGFGMTREMPRLYSSLGVVGEKGNMNIVFAYVGTMDTLMKAIVVPYVDYIETCIKEASNGFEFMRQEWSEKEFRRRFSTAVLRILQENKFGTLYEPQLVSFNTGMLTFAGDNLRGIEFQISTLNRVTHREESFIGNFGLSTHLLQLPEEVRQKLEQEIQDRMFNHGGDLQVIEDGRQIPGMGKTRRIEKIEIDGWTISDVTISPRVILGISHHREVSFLYQFSALKSGSSPDNTNHFGPQNTHNKDIDRWLEDSIQISSLDGSKIGPKTLSLYEEELNTGIKGQIQALLTNSESIFGIKIQGDIHTQIRAGGGKEGYVTVISTIPTNMGIMNISWVVKVEGELDEAFLEKISPLHLQTNQNPSLEAAHILSKRGFIEPNTENNYRLEDYPTNVELLQIVMRMHHEGDSYWIPTPGNTIEDAKKMGLIDQDSGMRNGILTFGDMSRILGEKPTPELAAVQVNRATLFEKLRIYLKKKDTNKLFELLKDKLSAEMNQIHQTNAQVGNLQTHFDQLSQLWSPNLKKGEISISQFKLINISPAGFSFEIHVTDSDNNTTILNYILQAK